MDPNLNSFYTIHDFVNIEILQKKIDLKTNYEHYFRYFKTEKKEKIVNYKIREFAELFLPKERLINDDTIIGFDKGFCLPKEQYAITLENNQITEYTNIPNNATNLWIQYILLQNNKCLVHAAAAEINGMGIVFPAFGGAGKTTLISELRKFETFKFFSDDYVIIDDNSNMYSYPQDLSIYGYHLKQFPELLNTKYQDYLNKKAKQKKNENIILRIPILNLIFRIIKLGKSYLKKNSWDLDYVKVPVNEIIPHKKIGVKTKLKAGIFLKRYTGNELKIEKMEVNQMINEIIGILHIEFKYSLIYLHLLAAFGIVNISEIEGKQRQILQSSLSNLELFQVYIPERISPDDYCNSMIQFVMKLKHNK